MAIDLNNGYRDLLDLWRTDPDASLRLVVYGDPVDPDNIAIEDEESHSVVIDFDRPEIDPDDGVDGHWVIVSASMRQVWDGSGWSNSLAEPMRFSLKDAIETAAQLLSDFEARVDDSNQSLTTAEMTDIMPQILKVGTQWKMEH